MAIRMAGVILLFVTAVARGQSTCSAKVAAALKLAKGDGSSIACCAKDSANCSLSATGDCPESQPNYVWCLGAGDSKSCALSYSSDTDAPCGGFSGGIGATYGISPIASGYHTSFSNPVVQEALISNWDSLSLLSDASLCTASDDRLAVSPSEPHVAKLLTLSQNPCNTGEFNWKCYGTKTNGLCMVYANTTSTSDIGQYYLLNLDPSAPQPISSSASATSPLASSPSTHSVVASQTTDPEATSKGKPNLVAIIVPVVVAVLLLGLFLVWFLRRRAAKRESGAQREAPVPYSHSMVDMSSNVATVGNGSASAEGANGQQAWTTSSRTQLMHQASQPSYGQPVSSSNFDIPNDTQPTPFVGKRGMVSANTNRAHPPTSDLPPYSV
ncbi:hypothetical protein BKA62DRAFT_693677 [Auriculariales sp. MPI-PUGE-AT-0066]|nr:hypothetical protein BKA62DRAFT_693677 [Auriculariales sp. MPI-PUGE-AT-0066]